MSDETVETLKSTLEELNERDAELTELVGEEFENDIIQYVKLTVRETKDMEPLTKPAVSGIQLIQVDGTHAQFSEAWSNFWSSMIKPEHIIDGNPETSWRDEKLKPVILELTEPAALLGYRMQTSCEDEGTDPKHWLVEGSKEKDGDWHVIHDMDEDASLPADRGSWSILIPLKQAGDKLADALRLGDSHEQATKESKREKERAREVAETGPTRAEVDEMQHQRNAKEDLLHRNCAEEEVIREDLEEITRKVEREERRHNEFFGRMKREIYELVDMVCSKYDEGNVGQAVEVVQGSRLMGAISEEREDELQRINAEMEASRQADTLRTSAITRLQVRCAQEIPSINDESEGKKHAIIQSHRKDMQGLDHRLAVLEVENRELQFHTKRGTNYKSSWKARRGKDGEKWEDPLQSLRAAENMRRMIEEEAEVTAELTRLRKEYYHLVAQYKEEKKACSEEIVELKKLFNDTHRERSQLGQERCELEAICADFSSVIERLQGQLIQVQGGGPPHASSTPRQHTRLVSPMATKFTIGNGRLSPRPSVSPRRSVRSVSESYSRSSPRPIPRVVSMTPR